MKLDNTMNTPQTNSFYANVPEEDSCNWYDEYENVNTFQKIHKSRLAKDTRYVSDKERNREAIKNKRKEKQQGKWE